MLRHYLKTAVRSLRASKTSTIINLLGLGLGLAAFIGIGAYVRYERSYDRMLVDGGGGAAGAWRGRGGAGGRTGKYTGWKKPNFYKGDQLTDDWATSTNGYALALKEHFPEVSDFTRISWTNSERVVRYGDVRFREEHVCFADSNFFSFFRYGWIEGNKATALTGVGSGGSLASVGFRRTQIFRYRRPAGKDPGDQHCRHQLSLSGHRRLPGPAAEFDDAVLDADLLGYVSRLGTKNLVRA